MVIRRHAIICPNCKGQHCRPSHRSNVSERVVSWVGIRPFRCRDCRLKFWKFGRKVWLSDDPAPSRVIAMIAALKESAKPATYGKKRAANEGKRWKR